MKNNFGRIRKVKKVITMNLLDEVLNIELVIAGAYALITAETLVNNYLKESKRKAVTAKDYLGDIAKTGQ